MSNIVNAVFDGSRRKAITCPLFQYDYGQIMKISGIELPASYQVQFSNTEDAGVSKTMLGDADGVQIPDEYLLTGDYIYAFVYLHETEDDGETEYVIEIPVIRRPVPSEETPTPAEQSLIDQLLEQLNQGVEAAEAAADQAGEAAETAVAGMIDDTLTIQGKAADAKKTGDEISQLKSDLKASTNPFRIDLTGQLQKGYITVGTVDIGGTVDPTVRSGGYKTKAFACEKGDVFIITGYLNANAPRLWGFTDSQYTLLSKSENKTQYTDYFLVAPADGYAIFTFIASSEYELARLDTRTDTTLSASGMSADAKAVGDNLDNINNAKQNICFSYVPYDNISWTVNGSKCNLTITNMIRVRYDVVNATVDTTAEQFLSIAEASSLVTVSDGVVSGTHFAVIFDFSEKTIKIADTSTRSTFSDCVILFYWHYGIVGGQLVEAKNAIDVRNNVSNIAEIQAQLNSTLADYFETEAEACKDSLISACSEKSFVIAFTTDNHYGASNGSNFPTTVDTIRAVNKKYPVDIVIDGGDLINGDETKANAITRVCNSVNMLNNIGKPVYTLIGNHDDESFTATELPLFSKTEMYALFARHYGLNLDAIGESEQYGYKDFDQYGLRLIVLDSMQGNNGHQADQWGYSAEQLAWFTNEALDTTNQVLIFSHMPFTKEYSAYNYQVANGAEMRSAVESFIANGGVCVGLFHGHTHWDFIGQYSQTNGFHEVSTGCSRVQSGYPSGAYMPDGATAQERTSGTVTQELWDLIVIKPESREVNIIRFGAGNDRSFTY